MSCWYGHSIQSETVKPYVTSITGWLRRICFIAGVTLLLVGQTTKVHAEVCYAYDRLGRLVGVVDEAGRTGIYDYDSVGNILAIRRNDATGPVAITLVTQTGGIAGDQVQNLGIGFSNVVSENQVTIGGVAANVLSATSCTLTLEIPTNAASGAIQVTTPSGKAVSSESISIVGISISPAKETVVIGRSRQFTATVTGVADQRVAWSVNDFDGGFPAIGTIAPDGVYTAPAAVPAPPTVALQARSFPFPELFSEATVTIVAEGNRFASAAPVSVFFGPPPPGTVVSPAVSVFFGIPPASVFAPAVSVANGPVITAVTPNSGAQGTTINLAVSGLNFSGATSLVFVLDGHGDSAINVGSLNVNQSGDQVTTTVTIALSATPGPRVVVVKTASGNSTAANNGNNVFEVTAP